MDDQEKISAQEQTAEEAGKAAAEKTEEQDANSGRDAETQAGQPQADLRIQLTKEELYVCMGSRQGRKAGRARLIVETVLLGLLAAYCIIAFFLSGMVSLATLCIGLISLLLAAAIWAAPVIVNRYDANREFAKNKVLRVRIYTQGLGFGTDDTFQLVPYEDCCARWCRDMILLDFEGGLMVALPKRLLDGGMWEQLVDRLHLSTEKNADGR